MDVNYRNLVTASGDSDPQMSAVGGQCSPQVSLSPSSTKSVGSLKQGPTANNGVGNTTAVEGAEQALDGGRKATEVTATGTTEEGTALIDTADAMSKLSKSVRSLKHSISTQDGGLQLLFKKAAALEVFSEKSRSPAVKEAILEVLAVVGGLKESREVVIRACNATLISTLALETSGKSPATRGIRSVSVACQTELAVLPVSCVMETQTPCWWSLDDRTPEEQPASSKQTSKAQGTPADPGLRTDKDQGKQPKKKRQQQQPQQQQPQQPQQRQQKQQQQQRQQQRQQPQQQQQQQRQQPQQQQQRHKEQVTWSEVVKKKKRKKPATPSTSSSPPAGPPLPAANSKLAMLRQRAPKTAAVTIDRPAEGGSLAAVMKRVAGTVDLGALGVKVLTTRRTRAGGILLEVEGDEKPALLEVKIREAAGDAARVRRPERRTPVLLLNVPEWAEVGDVVSGLARAGIAVTESAVSLRSSGGRRGDLDRVARVDLPLRDAIALAVVKAVQVGWTRCRVKLLEQRQSTCFRCQQKGHFAAECRNEAKPRSCFNCGAPGHLAKGCPSRGGRRGSSGSSGPKADGSR